MVDNRKTETRWIPCNACGADAFHELHRIGEWHVGKCSVCSLIYVNPMPFFKKSDYHHISQSFYYTKLQYEITPAKIEFERRQILSQVEEISKLAPDPAQLKTFLDVGCGPGLAVHAAVEFGWKAIGIDIDSKLVQLGKEQFGVDLYCRDIIESCFSENQFSFVRFKSTLQLLPNPYQVLVEVNRVLVPGGVVLIVVPNEEGLLNQVSLLFGGKRKKGLGTLVLPYHLHAFTPTTLKRLLARAGLKIISIKTATPNDAAYTWVNPSAEGTFVKRKALRLAWRCAAVLNKGSLLVAYARKEPWL